MLTRDNVRDLFDYDLVELRWKISPTSNVKAGDLAGCVNGTGYRQVRCYGKIYNVHRVIWLWMRRAWPLADIDHIDGDRLNNRWGNIREATRSQNHMNKMGYGSVGLKGVTRLKNGKFQAQIGVDGKNKYIGVFRLKKEAHKAYISEAIKLFGNFTRAK